jgi:hypothetical protein
MADMSWIRTLVSTLQNYTDNFALLQEQKAISLEERVRGIRFRAGIFKESMGARNRGGRGLSYRPARLHRLTEFIPWNRFRGPIHV